jgi:hypothetical protein
MSDTDTVMLTIRLPRELRDQFAARLEIEDQTASQVLRRAIRQFLQQGVSVAQPLPSFSAPATEKAQGAVAAPVATAASVRPEGKPFAGIRAMLDIGGEED